MKMGHDVTIFSASTVHNSDTDLITDGSKWREETVDGVHHVYIKCCGYHGNGLKRVLNMYEFAWRLPGVCRKFPKPDAVVATSMPPMSCDAGIRLAHKYGCKGIAEIADLWPESLIAYEIAGKHNPAVLYLRRLEKRIYTKADAVIFTMEGAYDYIIEQGWEKDVPREKIFFINNGVDLEAFDYNKEHYKIDDPDLENPDIFKVVYAGSIRKVNNLGLLLDTAKQVKDPKIKFLIWGDGDEREALENRVRNENISNVVFKGRVEKKYIPYITSFADLNIAHNTPSPLFRFGISFNKLFDYLAAGKPILSDFPCPYNPAIQYGAGVSVDEPSACNIAGQIEKITELTPEKYAEFCANAKKAALEYDFKNLTQKLINVIEGTKKEN